MNMLARTLIGTVATVLAGVTVSHAAEGWIIKDSPHSVSETADRLEAAIEESPAKLVVRLDHQENAQSVGLDMSPATVLFFGNPKVGTPIMQVNPRAALDLPLRVLVWEEHEKVRIGYLSAEALAQRYGIQGADEAFGNMAKALNGLTSKAIAKEE